MTGTIQQFDYSLNLLRSILWEYENAPNLQAILQGEQEWYNVNQQQFWESWYGDIFDLRTCNDFGLTVWSIILGLPLYVNLTTDDRATWGFEEFHLNYTRGNFATGSGGTIRLSPVAARTILRLRYYQLTSAGCVPEINRMIADVFSGFVSPGDSPGYVVDNHDMTMTYNFLFSMSVEIQFAIRFFDVLPRPSGVELDIVIV